MKIASVLSVYRIAAGRQSGFALNVRHKLLENIFMPAPKDGIIDSLTASYADSDVMGVFLAQVAELFKDEFIIMFMDKAPWHTTGKLMIPENMTIVFLPPYSPQLNPVEHLWKEIREKFFANRVFADIGAVEDQLFDALVYMNSHPEIVQSFAGFSWIVTSF